MTLASRNVLAVRDVQTGRAAYVPRLDLDAVQRLMDAGAEAPRAGMRDALLVATLFDGCLRVTEVLGLRPVDLRRSGHGWSAWIVGKGAKRGEVAVSASLVARLQAYAYQRELPRDGRFFPRDPGTGPPDRSEGVRGGGCREAARSRCGPCAAA